MKPTPRLADRMGPAEYVFSRGAPSRAAAEERIEGYIAAGEVSEAEKPRAVSYLNTDGARRWAVVLTDTGLAAYT